MFEPGAGAGRRLPRSAGTSRPHDRHTPHARQGLTGLSDPAEDRVCRAESFCERGLALFSSPDSPGAFDSVLAAVALETGARLVSADEAFSKVRGLRISVLNRDGFEALLRSGDPGDGNGDD